MTLTAPRLKTRKIRSDLRGARRAIHLIGTSRARKDHNQSEAVLTAEWLATDRIKQVAEQPIFTVTRSIFERQRQAVIEALLQREPDDQRAYYERFQAQKDPALIAAIFDLDFWNEEFADQMEPATIEAIRDGFETALQRIGREDIEDAFNADRPRVRRTILEVEAQSRHVNRQTQDVISDVVTDGLAEGESFGEIADRIDDRFTGWKRWRARTHARTAGTASFEAGQQDSFDLADVPRRAWLTQRDGRVRGLDFDDRFDHASADGQIADTGQPFEVSGEMLRFPGDPAGSPGNVINCRCTQLPRLDEDG